MELRNPTAFRLSPSAVVLEIFQNNKPLFFQADNPPSYVLNLSQCHDQSCTLFLKLDIEIICIFSFLTHPYIQPFTEPSDIAFISCLSYIHSYHLNSNSNSLAFLVVVSQYIHCLSVFQNYHYNYVPKIKSFSFHFPFLT